MPYDELLGWMAFFERRPTGWREDDRAFKLIQAQGFKGKPYEVFGSLEVIYNPPTLPTDVDGLNLKSLKRSKMFSNMLAAKGGDSLDLLKDL